MLSTEVLMETKLTDERIKEIARIIEMVKIAVFAFAPGPEELKKLIEDIKISSKQMGSYGNFMDSAAVLNPNYMPEKADVVRVQATGLGYLSLFLECLLKSQEGKDKVRDIGAARERISKMFM